MIYGFYLLNVVLFRIKPNSEDPNKEPTWWDKIRNQNADWYYKSVKDPATLDPQKVRRFKVSLGGITEDNSIREDLEALKEAERQKALESDDPMIRKKWGFLPTKYGIFFIEANPICSSVCNAL